MIRIHRNHPSIIVWSMDNEVFFTENSTLPKVRELLKETVGARARTRSHAPGSDWRLPARRH